MNAESNEREIERLIVRMEELASALYSADDDSEFTEANRALERLFDEVPEGAWDRKTLGNQRSRMIEAEVS